MTDTFQLAYYVSVHDGGGSMSECASVVALFGPYSKAESEEVMKRLEPLEGYDSGLHVRLVDPTRATVDVDAFLERVNR